VPGEDAWHLFAVTDSTGGELFEAAT
jgi:hypothetical protein